jgi:ribose transport system permease protein
VTQLEPSRTTAVPPVAARSVSAPAVVLRWLGRYPMLVVLVALLVLATVVYPDFWTTLNLQNLLSQNAPLAVASAGMTLVMIAGGFDLSVGAAFGAGAVFYITMDGTLPAPVAVLGSLVIGALIGLFNGAVVNVLGVNPFVATLGSASVITGFVSLYYTHAHTKYADSDSYRVLGTDKWAGVPVSALVAVVVLVVAGLLLARTVYGRSIYALGGNAQAARLNGLRVGVVSASTFVIIGVLATLGGVLQASQVATADPSFGNTLTLDAIAVVIIGGTSLLGGDGAVWRTVVGIAILAIINNVFAAKSIDASLQSVIKGAIVIVAVAIDVFVHRRQST